MKILFVSSGNKAGISPIVKAQGESLKNNGIELEYFVITGKGLKGYLKNVFRLRKYLKAKNFDIVHSHFFLSSLVATLSKPNRLVVSLMGGDVYEKLFWKILINLLASRWDALIVKSEKMKQVLGLDDLNIIPNGVKIDSFYPIDQKAAREKLHWGNKKYILFDSNPSRPEKKFELAKKAVESLKDIDIELVTLNHIPHDQIVYYLNATNLLLMTSKYEGSPNIIKEAMACNCPLVSTDVGDVRWVIGNTNGCYLASFDYKDVAQKIKKALQFSEKCGKTTGRDRITELNLDSETIAKKIIEVHKKVIQNAE